MNEPVKLHTIAFRMPEENYEALRYAAYKNRVSVAAAVRQAVKEFCEKWGK